MRVRVYDPARTPAHWLEIIQPGQYSVFVLAAGRRTPPPGEAYVEIAPDFETALKFAEETVAQDPSLCCEIYDHRGKAGEPLQTVYEPSVRGKYEGRPRARKEMLAGVGLLAVALTVIAYDVKRDLTWFWGSIIGIKLTIVGGAFLVRGVSRYIEARRDA
jgi:hypothetical protein